MGLGGLGTKGLGLGLDNWLRSSVRLYKYNWWCSPSTCWTTPSSLKKRVKWATGLLGMTFIFPYCNTGSFINEVLSYSKLCYFWPLWPTLGYSGLLWTTLDYFNWFKDFGLRMTQGYQLDHKDSFKTFLWLIGLLDSFMTSLLLFRLLKLSFIMFSLNLVDYPMFSLLLSTWNDLGHLPDTQGY